MGVLVVESEEVQIERVITRIAHRMTVKVSHPLGGLPVHRPLGSTMDLVSLAWDVFDRSAIASLELSTWLYFPWKGKIQAVSRIDKLKIFVGIPEITSSMHIEAQFCVEDIEITTNDLNDEVVIEACALLEGLVLEKCILHVVTGVSMKTGVGRVEQEAQSPARQRLLSDISSRFKEIIDSIRRNRYP